MKEFMHKNKIKIEPFGYKDWTIFCDKADKEVSVDPPGPGTTALALCSYCGGSVHYGDHKNMKKEIHE